jgi:hypothetical protein
MASEQIFSCPNCGYEYEEWVKECPDCGTPIESRPRLEVIKGTLAPDEDPHWTIVTNVPNSILGNFVKSQLEDAGIPVLMFRSRSADIAEFSHNDYVPQDLLVPRNMWRQARRLIDSAPGDHFGPYLLQDDSEDYEEDVDTSPDDGDGAVSPTITRAGSEFDALPTEADLHARQQVRRTHGEVLRGWYWSDEPGGRQADDESYEDETGYVWQDDRPAGNLTSYEERAASRHTSGDYGYDWTRPSSAAKIVYGVLLLVLTLPFIIQVLQTIWSILGNFPR